MTAPTKDTPPRRKPGTRIPLGTEGLPADKPLIDFQPVPDKPETPSKVTYRPGILVKPLTSFYETIGGMILLVDVVCGQAVIESAEGAAKSLDELARVNPKVRQALLRLISGSVLTQVVVAHLPIIMAIVAHHFPKALVYVAQIFSGGKVEPGIPDAR